MSDEEYAIARDKLVALQEQRALLDARIQAARDVVEAMEHARRNLPTEPGMYFHPDEGWPAVLTSEGRWHDGWGNDFEGEEHLEGLKRVVFVENPGGGS